MLQSDWLRYSLSIEIEDEHLPRFCIFSTNFPRNVGRCELAMVMSAITTSTTAVNFMFYLSFVLFEA